jgi:Flp pilus assembly pilin Flp
MGQMLVCGRRICHGAVGPLSTSFSQKRVQSELERLAREEDGLEMIEWAVLGAVIALVCTSFYAGLGYRIAGMTIDISNLF